MNRPVQRIIGACLLCPLAFGASSCSRSHPAVVEGIILYASYQYPDGSIHGFTRLNRNTAVPGGNGSWNIDARGKLTREFLVVTRPQHPDLGPLVIPVQRLVEVQFGDGGIQTVNESQPAPPK
jgi:hypothetical protein